MVFDTIGILEWARLAPVERVEGVLCTPEGPARINRQGNNLHIEVQNAVPLDSRIKLISSSKTDWNVLQSVLLKLRSATTV